jgi:beta-lactamase superfamily II metal-dependent hydrolase
MLRIEILPAGRGDCLLVQYGEKAPFHSILIDGGPKANYPSLHARLEKLRREGRLHLELLVATHIDVDHIEGVVELLEEAQDLGLTVGDVWFNGFRHLPDEDDLAAATPAEKEEELTLGPNQGERLTELIGQLRLPWNKRFSGRAVAAPDEKPPTAMKLDGGMKVTVLSPTRTALAKLRPKWEEVIGRAGITLGSNPLYGEPDPDDLGEVPPEELTLGGRPNIDKAADAKFTADTSPANGSSIAFLAEYGDKRLLLTGDALPGPLLTSVRHMLPDEDERLTVNLFKPSHHGSRRSLSPQLLDALDCDTFVISTDGSYFKHPNVEAIARIIRHATKPTLAFNYRTDYNDMWDDRTLIKKEGYSVQYPHDEESGIILEL